MSYCVCCSYNESCGKSCSSCCFSTRDKILRTWKYTTKCICLKTKTIEKEGTSPENKTISENVCTIKLIQLVMLLGLIGLIEPMGYRQRESFWRLCAWWKWVTNQKIDWK